MTVLLSIFFICLFYSQLIKDGIKNGLILLSDQVIPALYPFVLLSSIIKQNYSFSNSYFLIGISFLSGYPLGAKIIAEHDFSDIPLSSQELLLLCNNPSLPYLICYIGPQCLDNPFYGILIYFCIIIGNIIYVCLHHFIYKLHGSNNKQHILTICEKSKNKTANLFHDCFSTLLNISNYILIFSICASIINSIVFIPHFLRKILIGILEITTGAYHISLLNINTSSKITILTGIIAFGGMSVIFQTYEMIQNSKLSIKKYMTEKAISSLIAMSVMYGITLLLQL